MIETIRRDNIPVPPRGAQRFKWFGPGLLWMVSSIGSGSVLFTPRVGARYGYEFLWLALLFGFFMWIMIREVGRYTVVTGRTIFSGYNDISGKSKWALYFILVPQILAAVVTVAGIAALASSALMIVLPIDYEIIAVSLILLSLLVVISGHYKTIENITSVLAVALVLILVISASKAFNSPAEFAQGAIPGIPPDVDIHFIIPWVGFILAGASGIMWFSYWVAARNFGGKVSGDKDVVTIGDGRSDAVQNEEKYVRLRGWLGTLNGTSAVAVISGILVLTTFMVLGAELLRPNDIVPEGIKVAEDLAKLLSGLWGDLGKWLLVAGILIALIGTILSCQDGYGRMFADGTQLITKSFLERRKNDKHEKEGRPHERGSIREMFIRFLDDKRKLSVFYASMLGGALPLVIFFLVKDPVEILSIAGTVAAAHTPVVMFLTLYLNRNCLPSPLRPSLTTSIAMAIAGLAYGAFACYHFVKLGG